MAVNLEKSLTPSTPMGGHIVSGHVDGVAEVVKRQADGCSQRFTALLTQRLAVKVPLEHDLVRISDELSTCASCPI